MEENQEQSYLDPITAEQIRSLDGVTSTEQLTPQEIRYRYGITVDIGEIPTTYSPITFESLSTLESRLSAGSGQIVIHNGTAVRATGSNPVWNYSNILLSAKKKYNLFDTLRLTKDEWA